MYYKKYLKYKLKYINLKGGFRLDDKEDMIDEDGTTTDKTNYLYPRVLKYLQHFEQDFNNILTYINLIQYKLLYTYDSEDALFKAIILLETLCKKNEYDEFIKSLPSNIELLKNNRLKLFFQKILCKHINSISFINVTHPELIIGEDSQINISLFETYFNELSNEIKKIIDNILKSTERNEILNFLFTLYLKKNYDHVNIQYAAFVYLSFLLEFELFIMTYSNMPYNYFYTSIQYNYGYEKLNDNIKNDGIIFNNEFELKWIDQVTTKSVYNKLFESNIIKIFDKYIDFLEKFYKEFIDRLVLDVLDLTKFYNSEPRTYNHIKHDWYTQGILTKSLDNIIDVYIQQYQYNTHQNGFFDFVFALNHTRSCITKSILTLYLTSRLHIKDVLLLLQNELSTQYITHPYHQIPQEILKCTISHWECTINSEYCIIPEYITTKSFDIYNNKVEIFIAIIVEIYNKYKLLYNKLDISLILNFIFTLIIKILLTENEYKIIIKLYLKYNFSNYLSNTDEIHEIIKNTPADSDLENTYLEAIIKDPSIFNLLPDSLKQNIDFICKSISKNAKVYQVLHEDFKTEENIIKFIECNYLVYYELSDANKNSKLILNKLSELGILNITDSIKIFNGIFDIEQPTIAKTQNTTDIIQINNDTNITDSKQKINDTSKFNIMTISYF